MKKATLLFLVSVTLMGCSSNSSKTEMFIEAASACNQVCEANPAVRKVSSSAGGGFPLLFLGKMETSCQCER